MVGDFHRDRHMDYFKEKIYSLPAYRQGKIPLYVEKKLCAMFEEILSLEMDKKYLDGNYELILCRLGKINNNIEPNKRIDKYRYREFIECEWLEICNKLAEKQKADLKNHIDNNIIPQLSIILPYYTILEYVSKYICMGSSISNLVWVKEFELLMKTIRAKEILRSSSIECILP
jgi:hypothetical protein